VPPLLKSLSARGRILIKSLVLLSKSERLYGLGAGLQLVHVENNLIVTDKFVGAFSIAIGTNSFFKSLNVVKRLYMR